jgi:hypothetical protein
MALSLSWALLPVPLAAILRRRSRRRRNAGEAKPDSLGPIGSPESADPTGEEVKS